MAGPSIYNVPNALTTARFVLAIAVMALIPSGMPLAAMIVFLIAASTDWMDGYWARKYGQVTKLGRIFDPFVDKIIICGSFIALVEVPDSPVASWMATIVVARELLVTSLRGIIEGAGGDFSASWLGKWKMVLQCAAVVAVLLTYIVSPVPVWLDWTSWGLLWAAIALTVYSGVDYTMIAARVMQSDAGLEVPAEPSIHSSTDTASSTMHPTNDRLSDPDETSSLVDEDTYRITSTEMPTR
ncbi:CDP-diacylglycerol--glycerol-3-phosphate 3-phosphatidyltransferase [Rhodopirellula sp. JC740]|uniref:CDP-diacylglycerol--glycerol-3-phosphate 3-phosphatidyltransferase n=1 Tax=Rhodopirellula halodulae TaxID=2894198 RepID=A0ABS8NH80_9BACT|nr:CDP-diacylglycerol--glycerol-3-phosphate 3-phosphatidyltransferase [Rhodopirellula sp. JC740]MCC9642759.1 CDP-diacylglycerol--glycerol-3-phosphate 3-phosphatidyltransferase [Rhodopirellula sp. JC740]